MVTNLEIGSMVILAIIILFLLIAGILVIKVLIKGSDYTLSEGFITLLIIGIIFIFSIPLIMIFLHFL